MKAFDLGKPVTRDEWIFAFVAAYDSSARNRREVRQDPRRHGVRTLKDVAPVKAAELRLSR